MTEKNGPKTPKDKSIIDLTGANFNAAEIPGGEGVQDEFAYLDPGKSITPLGERYDYRELFRDKTEEGDIGREQGSEVIIGESRGRDVSEVKFLEIKRRLHEISGTSELNIIINLLREVVESHPDISRENSIKLYRFINGAPLPPPPGWQGFSDEDKEIFKQVLEEYENEAKLIHGLAIERENLRKEIFGKMGDLGFRINERNKLLEILLGGQDKFNDFDILYLGLISGESVGLENFDRLEVELDKIKKIWGREDDENSLVSKVNKKIQEKKNAKPLTSEEKAKEIINKLSGAIDNLISNDGGFEAIVGDHEKIAEKIRDLQQDCLNPAILTALDDVSGLDFNEPVNLVLSDNSFEVDVKGKKTTKENHKYLKGILAPKNKQELIKAMVLAKVEGYIRTKEQARTESRKLVRSIRQGLAGAANGGLNVATFGLLKNKLNRLTGVLEGKESYDARLALARLRLLEREVNAVPTWKGWKNAFGTRQGFTDLINPNSWRRSMSYGLNRWHTNEDNLSPFERAQKRAVYASLATAGYFGAAVLFGGASALASVGLTKNTLVFTGGAGWTGVGGFSFAQSLLPALAKFMSTSKKEIAKGQEKKDAILKASVSSASEFIMALLMGVTVGQLAAVPAKFVGALTQEILSSNEPISGTLAMSLMQNMAPISSAQAQTQGPNDTAKPKGFLEKIGRAWDKVKPWGDAKVNGITQEQERGNTGPKTPTQQAQELYERFSKSNGLNLLTISQINNLPKVVWEQMLLKEFEQLNLFNLNYANVKSENIQAFLDGLKKRDSFKDLSTKNLDKIFALIDGSFLKKGEVDVYAREVFLKKNGLSIKDNKLIIVVQDESKIITRPIGGGYPPIPEQPKIPSRQEIEREMEKKRVVEKKPLFIPPTTEEYAGIVPQEPQTQKPFTSIPPVGKQPGVPKLEKEFVMQSLRGGFEGRGKGEYLDLLRQVALGEFKGKSQAEVIAAINSLQHNILGNKETGTKYIQNILEKMASVKPPQVKIVNGTPVWLDKNLGREYERMLKVLNDPRPRVGGKLKGDAVAQMAFWNNIRGSENSSLMKVNTKDMQLLLELAKQRKFENGQTAFDRFVENSGYIAKEEVKPSTPITPSTTKIEKLAAPTFIEVPRNISEIYNPGLVTFNAADNTFEISKKGLEIKSSQQILAGFFEIFAKKLNEKEIDIKGIPTEDVEIFRFFQNGYMKLSGKQKIQFLEQVQAHLLEKIDRSRGAEKRAMVDNFRKLFGVGTTGLGLIGNGKQKEIYDASAGASLMQKIDLIKIIQNIRKIK